MSKKKETSLGINESIFNDFYPVKKYCSLDVSLQDAHNCILDFDEDTAMFAVYDGHGGKFDCKLQFISWLKLLFCCCFEHDVLSTCLFL